VRVRIVRGVQLDSLAGGDEGRVRGVRRAGADPSHQHADRHDG